MRFLRSQPVFPWLLLGALCFAPTLNADEEDNYIPPERTRSRARTVCAVLLLSAFLPTAIWGGIEWNKHLNEQEAREREEQKPPPLVIPAGKVEPGEPPPLGFAED